MLNIQYSPLAYDIGHFRKSYVEVNNSFLLFYFASKHYKSTLGSAKVKRRGYESWWLKKAISWCRFHAVKKMRGYRYGSFFRYYIFSTWGLLHDQVIPLLTYLKESKILAMDPMVTQGQRHLTQMMTWMQWPELRSWRHWERNLHHWGWAMELEAVRTIEIANPA